MAACGGFDCPPELPWSDLAFALLAACTATVATVLNLVLLVSATRVGAAPRHPVALQFCVCGLLASAALSCHVQQLWGRGGDGAPCRTPALAALFSHTAFVTLSVVEPRIRRRECLLGSVIAWCWTAVVVLSGCTGPRNPITTALLFSLYALNVPFVALLAVRRIFPRSVSPGSPQLPCGTRAVLPRLLLFFAATLPQALLTGAEALPGTVLPRSAEAWGCLSTALFAALRPPLDALLRPELGHAATDFVGSLCRRKEEAVNG